MFSVERACAAAGLPTVITSDPREIQASAGILLPGVGAFGDAMQALRRLNLVGPLREGALSDKPIIGICLGMQLLFGKSEEFGEHRGLDLLPGRVVRFRQPRGARGPLKVPQVGWNAVVQPCRDAWQGSPLEQTPNHTAQYFVHSYYAEPADVADVLATTRYGDIEFCSAVRRRNVVGFQFHPERSGPAGLQIYAQIAEFIRRHANVGESRNVA